MNTKRYQVLVVVIPLLLSIAAPALGLTTAEWGFRLLVAALVIFLAIVGTPIEHRVRLWLLDRLPVGFRWPIYRKARPPKVVRPPAPLGALDFELLMSRASDVYSKALTRLAGETARSGGISEKHTPRMVAVSDASTERKIAASRAYAREQSKSIDAMEKRAGEVAAAGVDVRENTIQRLKTFPAGTDLSGFRRSVAEMRAQVDEGLESLRGLRSAVVSVRTNNIQQAVNDVSDRHIKVLDGTIAEYEAMRKFVREAFAELDRRDGPRPLNRAARRSNRGAA